MNIANKLTLFRVVLIPVFVFFVMMPELFFHNFLWAVLIFATASITDAVDGRIARKYSQVTDFGKFADPLADKMLVISAVVCLVGLGALNSVAALIIILREFMVTSFRLLASNKGVIIAADSLGKIKTVAQTSCIVFLLFKQELVATGLVLENSILNIISLVLVWLVVILTVVSGCSYVKSNASVIWSSPNE